MYSKVLLGLLILSWMWLPAVGLAAESSSRADDGIVEVEAAPPGGDFTMQSSEGPVSLQDLRGRVVALYFGYTRCPDVCPTSLAFLAQALNELRDEELPSVRGLFISVDPKRDTLSAIAEYAAYFHPNIIGVSGSEAQLAAVARGYGAKYYEVELEDSASGYSVNHSAVTYLIAPDGALRFIFPHGTPPSVILEAIRYLLAGN